MSSIYGSCGCKFRDKDGKDGMGNLVKYSKFVRDGVDGFVNADVYDVICNACLEKYREWYPDLELIP